MISHRKVLAQLFYVVGVAEQPFGAGFESRSTSFFQSQRVLFRPNFRSNWNEDRKSETPKRKINNWCLRSNSDFDFEIV